MDIAKTLTFREAAIIDSVFQDERAATQLRIAEVTRDDMRRRGLAAYMDVDQVPVAVLKWIETRLKRVLPREDHGRIWSFYTVRRALENWGYLDWQQLSDEIQTLESIVAALMTFCEDEYHLKNLEQIAHAVAMLFRAEELWTVRAPYPWDLPNAPADLPYPRLPTDDGGDGPDAQM